MNDDLKMALYIGVAGFVIMIAASIALWNFHASEVGCSVVMAIGVVIVIVAIIYASFPQFFDRFRKKDEQQPVATEEVSGQDEESIQEEGTVQEESVQEKEAAPAENGEEPKE